MTYHDKNVTSTLMSRLGMFREQGILTDITLTTEGENFKAHKVVLSSHSDYFRALFTDPMLECESNVVSLSTVTARGLKVILDYVYTSVMNICIENVVEVLQAASYLLIESAMLCCNVFLRKNIDYDNVLDIINIADTYSLEELKCLSHIYLAANLSKIMNRNETFYTLSTSQMEYFLTSELLTDCSEHRILEFVLNWFLKGTDKEIELKLNKADDIIKSIKFFNISDKELCKVVARVFPDEAIRKNHVIYKIILERKFLSKNINESYCLTNSINMRGMEKAFILIGGICDDGITNDLSCTYINKNDWKFLTTIPHVDQCNYGTAVYKNILYIVGGCYNQCGEEVLHPYAFSYDPSKDVWQTLQAMRQARCRFTLTLLGDNLYAIGGNMDDYYRTNASEDGSTLCDKYNIAENKWTNVCCLPQSLSQHAASSLSFQGEEFIYVSGGLHCGNVMSKVYAYDPFKNVWCSKTDLLVGRVDHSMFQYKNKLYVCGGWNYTTQHLNQRHLIRTIDMYDPETDSWKIVTHNEKPTYHCGIVMDDSKIYFIGGFNQDDDFNKTFENVECYDVETNLWTIVDEKPPEIWEHNCLVMYIPKHAYYEYYDVS